MDSIRYLIDTNILIYHFADKIPEEEQLKINTILKNSFNISIITEIEFLGWQKHTKNGFNKAKELLQSSRVINIDKQIASKTIEIRQKHSVKLPDALISATALNGDYTLITRNTKDFISLGLRIYNPFKAM